MIRSNSRLRLLTSAALAAVLINIPTANAEEPNRPGRGGSGHVAVVSDSKPTLFSELAKSRYPVSLASSYPLNGPGSWLKGATQARSEPAIAETANRVERRGWWGRNWRWVVLPAVGVAAGFGAVVEGPGRCGSLVPTKLE